MHQGQRLKSISKKSKTAVDRALYNRSRNTVNQFKRNLQRDYYANALEEAGDNNKKLWHIIKQLPGNKKRKRKSVR